MTPTGTIARLRRPLHRSNVKRAFHLPPAKQAREQKHKAIADWTKNTAFLHNFRMGKQSNDDLKPADERFAALLAQCLAQTEAYRKSHACEGIAPQTIAERASRLAAKPQVKARVQALLREAKVPDLDSIGEAYKDLLNDIDGARAAKNWTALATMHRIRLQVLGMLKDTVNVTIEQRMSDDELIRRLADGDQDKAALLRQMMGKPDEYLQ